MACYVYKKALYNTKTAAKGMMHDDDECPPSTSVHVQILLLVLPLKWDMKGSAGSALKPGFITFVSIFLSVGRG